MDAMGDVVFRRPSDDEQDEVYRVFRSSIVDYLRQIGQLDGDYDDDIEEAWERQGSLMQHLQRTAAQDWIAEDGNGELLGMARTIERDGHVQLTHFFVRPGSQASGVGRGLIERAFAREYGKHRSIIATQHERALSLYLRSGVNVQGVAVSLSKAPEETEIPTTLRVEKVGPGEFVEQAMAAIDEAVLGYRRIEDTRFFLEDRPAFLFRRGNDVVGYLFASNGRSAGPGAVLDRSDLPALIVQQERYAIEQGHDEVMITLAFNAADTFSWALDHGFRIWPFYEMLLADAPYMKLDQYLLTQPGFTW